MVNLGRDSRGFGGARSHGPGRAVVITGASSGIGQATAEAFARRGARLVLVARDGAALEAVARDCRRLGAAALPIAADVTDAAAIARVARRAAEFGDGIDVWVSNVGTGAVGAFHEVPVEAHAQVVRASLIGHINDAHAVLPVFLRQGRGVFVNMISLGGFAATPYAASYSAAKFGLRGFGEALRGELARHPGIHVCDIYPSFVDSPGLSHGANYTGRELSAPPPVLDPRRVAEAIVALAARPRPTTMVGLPTPLLRLAHALAPELTMRVMARVIEAGLRRGPRQAKGSGNLFRPPPTPGGVEGGLRSSGQRAGVAVVALGAVAAGLLLAGARRRQNGHRSTRGQKDKRLI